MKSLFVLITLLSFIALGIFQGQVAYASDLSAEVPNVISYSVEPSQTDLPEQESDEDDSVEELVDTEFDHISLFTNQVELLVVLPETYTLFLNHFSTALKRPPIAS